MECTLNCLLHKITIRIVPRFGIKRKRPKNSEIFPIKSKVASAKSNSNVL